MSGEVFFFIVFSIGTIVGAVFVLVVRKVVYALLSAVLTFISISGLYILLTAEFIAGVQLFIYSGAITILLLFAIMLTNQSTKEVKCGKSRWHWLLTLTIGLLFFVMLYGSQNRIPIRESFSYDEKNTEQIGELLFTRYMIPFELISVLLLVALIGAIVLAKKEEPEEEKVRGNRESHH